jgi:hypothetical protein
VRRVPGRSARSVADHVKHQPQVRHGTMASRRQGEYEDHEYQAAPEVEGLGVAQLASGDRGVVV